MTPERSGGKQTPEEQGIAPWCPRGPQHATKSMFLNARMNDLTQGLYICRVMKTRQEWQFRDGFEVNDGLALNFDGGRDAMGCCLV